MAADDEKDLTVAMPPDDATVAMSDAPDDATVAMSDVPDAPGDATVAMDDVPAADDETTRLPDGSDDVTVELRDGIDALDDPYYAPAVPEDLTTAHAPVSIPSPVESLPERKPRFPRWGIALIVVVLLAAAGAVACVTYEQELWGGKTVPNVMGQSEDEARRTLESLGFSVDVSYSAVDEDYGVVLGSKPVPGVRVDPADGITLTVSASRVIPDVVGLSVDDATAALTQAGAANVSLTYRNSEEAPGTVLAVDPGEGEPFVSSDPVTLTVAQSYTVPNVMDLTVDDAMDALKAAGLAGSVTYVESDAERGTVVGVSPSVGSGVSAGSTVELSVSSPYPSSPTELLEYFEVKPEDLATYLADEGFSLRYGATFAAGGNAHAAYANEAGDLLQITDAPESGSYPGDSTADVLARGAGVGGVRYAFSADSLPKGGSVEAESGVRAIMEECGLTGLDQTCTAADAQLPEELLESDAYKSAHFICAVGEQGDYTWAVIIGGTGSSSHVVALAAPTSHFSGVDLSDFGGSLCSYLVYFDLFAG